MVEIAKIMTTDVDGTKRQIMPQTHVSAILGFDENIFPHSGEIVFKILDKAPENPKVGDIWMKR